MYKIYFRNTDKLFNFTVKSYQRSREIFAIKCYINQRNKYYSGLIQ